MKKKEIINVFKKLKINTEILSKLNDPDTVAEEMRECSILEPDEVTYSIGTKYIEEKSNAEMVIE